MCSHLFLSLLFWISIFDRISITSGHTSNDTKALYKNLMNKYDKNIRPIKNQSAPIVVKFGLGLLSIKEFDEVKESLSVNSFFSLVWFDEFMKWDPKQYGGITNFVRESGRFWTPHVVLVNTVKKIEKIGDSWQLVRYKNNGQASFFPGEVLEAACKVDITYYPFDRHICSLNFTIWASWWTEVSLQKSSETVYLMHYSENGAWDLIDSGYHISYSTYGAVNIDVLLLLERKPQFVVVNVVIPMICLVFLNALTFLMPIESGERISFSVSVLLSIAVFLTVTGDNLPKTSNPMPILSFYLLTVLTISALSTIASVLNTWIFYHNDSSPVPTVLHCLVRRYKTGVAQVVCCNNQKERDDDHGCDNLGEMDANGTMDNLSDTTSLNESFVSCICGSTFAGTLSKKDPTQNVLKEIEVTWKELSAAFDKIFLVICVAVLSVATVTFLLVVLTADCKVLPNLQDTESSPSF